MYLEFIEKLWIFKFEFLAKNNQFNCHFQVVKQDICKTCECNVQEKVVNCVSQNLFKLFDAKDWDTVTSNKSIACSNVEYVPDW